MVDSIKIEKDYNSYWISAKFSPEEWSQIKIMIEYFQYNKVILSSEKYELDIIDKMSDDIDDMRSEI